jgi:3-dehydroquinate dehydratase-2
VKKAILMLSGPNLNLLGTREPGVYGSLTLAEIEARIARLAAELGYELRCFQSNSEGALIDALHEARSWAAGAVFNPGGYSHSSVALRDAVAAVGYPVVEVHLSNIAAREEFRHSSIVAGACVGSVIGLGWRSYALALRGLAEMLDEAARIA